MVDKRFYNGVELKNGYIYFKNINHIPHITDIVEAYNLILEENKQLKKELGLMDGTKQFTAVRKKNPVTQEYGNYVQDDGTTILKLSSLEDCRDVCEILEDYNTISKKWSYYCDKYSCAKCPKREGYQCKNEDWIQ